MLNAEKFCVLAPEQFGSHKSLTSICQALNKVLTYNLICQRRIPAAMCSNDAKSCYNRIVHSVAKLALLHCGAPEPTVDLMFDAIRRLRHHIRTAFGDSTVSYGGDLKPGDPPKHGVGQGNGTGPAIWAILSTPGLDLLRSQGTSVNLQSALSHETLRMAGYSFVDDTDLPQVSESSTNFADVLHQMQCAVDLLGRCYLRHGGAIVPTKSFWYGIDFGWKPDGAFFYKPPALLPADLTVLDPVGQRAPLEHVQPFEGRRTLGLRAAPDGSQTAELQFL
jgi:hypothetical protein